MVTDRRWRMPDMVSIHLRPPEVEGRAIQDPEEDDFIKGATNTSSVGVLDARTSRLVLLAPEDPSRPQRTNQMLWSTLFRKAYLLSPRPDRGLIESMGSPQLFAARQLHRFRHPPPRLVRFNVPVCLQRQRLRTAESAWLREDASHAARFSFRDTENIPTFGHASPLLRLTSPDFFQICRFDEVTSARHSRWTDCKLTFFPDGINPFNLDRLSGDSK